MDSTGSIGSTTVKHYRDERELYIAPISHKILYAAANVHVTVGEKGTFSPMGPGILPKAAPKDADGSLLIEEDGPLITIDDEVDVGARMGTNDSSFRILLGVKWKAGESWEGTSLFAIKDCIVEFRKAVFSEAKPSKLTGTKTRYGSTFVSVGIPADRYNWIRQYVQSEFQLPVQMSAKDKPVSEGYVFVTANMPKDDGTNCTYVDNGQTKPVNGGITAMLTKLRTNVMGIGGLEVSLKRVKLGPRDPADTPVIRQLGFILRMFNLSSVTAIKAPELILGSGFIVPKEESIDAVLLQNITGEIRQPPRGHSGFAFSAKPTTSAAAASSSIIQQ